MHDKVFAYIVQSQHNETLECHAFLCAKRKMVSKLIFFKRLLLCEESTWSLTLACRLLLGDRTSESCSSLSPKTVQIQLQ